MTSISSLPSEIINTELPRWLAVESLVRLPYVCREWTLLFNGQFWSGRLMNASYCTRRKMVADWAATHQLLGVLVSLCIQNMERFDSATMEIVSLHLLEANRPDLVKRLTDENEALRTSFITTIPSNGLEEILIEVERQIAIHGEKITNHSQLCWISDNARLSSFLGEFLHRRLTKAKKKRWIAAMPTMDDFTFRRLATVYIAEASFQNKRSHIKKIERILKPTVNHQYEIYRLRSEWKTFRTILSASDPWKALIEHFTVNYNNNDPFVVLNTIYRLVDQIDPNGLAKLITALSPDKKDQERIIQPLTAHLEKRHAVWLSIALASVRQ